MLKRPIYAKYKYNATGVGDTWTQVGATAGGCEAGSV